MHVDNERIYFEFGGCASECVRRQSPVVSRRSPSKHIVFACILLSSEITPKIRNKF